MLLKDRQIILSRGDGRPPPPPPRKCKSSLALEPGDPLKDLPGFAPQDKKDDKTAQEDTSGAKR